MKKRVICISLLLVCITVLCSCGAMLDAMPAPANANQLMRRMNTRLEGLDGYRIDVTGNITAYADSTRITGKLEGFALEDQGKDKDDYYYHTEMTNRSQVGSMGGTVTVKSIEAYYDGYAYSHYSEGSTWRKICSPMTKREYLKYLSDDSMFEIKTDDCKNKKLEKKDDGYVAKYSGYSQEAIQDFFDTMDLTRDMFGRMPADLAVTVETDADYYPKTFTLTMVFEQKENSYYKPEFSMTMTFSQFNEVERKTKGFSPDKYTEIESLSLLKEVEELIEDRVQAKNGSFTVENEARVYFMTRSESQSETYDVSFSRDKKGFTFTCDETKEDFSQKITYADGKKTEEYNGKSYTDDMTEDQAEQYVANLINDPAMGYNANLVTTIRETEDGYEITLDVSGDSALGQIITSAGAKFSSGSHNIKIKVDGGKIIKIEHTYRANGSVQTGINKSSSLSYTGNLTVTFD